MSEQRDNKPVELPDIHEAVLKLCRHVDGLNRDVKQLLDRIQPRENEDDDDGGFSTAWLAHVEKTAPTLTGIMSIVRDADVHVREAEYDLNYIRNQIDQIARDSLSRDEIKPYIKPAGRRQD